MQPFYRNTNPRWEGNEYRFGPLLPFVGGLLVGGIFAPRPNYSYGPFPGPMSQNPMPPMGQAYPPAPLPMGYVSPYYETPNIPTYYANVQAENVGIYSQPQNF